MITFVTKFTLKTDDAEKFERLFTEHTAFMKAQPGFVDHHMVRSMSTPSVYLNVGRWKDVEAHRAVTSSEEFRGHVMAMAPLVDVEADLYGPVSWSQAAG